MDGYAGAAPDGTPLDHEDAKRAKEESYGDLLGALKAEEQGAVDYLESEVAAAQIEALKRYFGDPYGDEVEGSSQVRTREVFENVEWLRPTLRRVFTAGGRIVEYEGNTPEEDEYADEASDLINYVFLQDNPGEKILDDFIFDGLLQRCGFIAADWRAPKFGPAEEITGLNLVQAAKVLADKTVKVEAQQVRALGIDDAHPDGLFYDLKIRKRTEAGKAEVFTVAPEDILISARAVDLDTTPYVGDIIRMKKGEAATLWPEYADEIRGYAGRTGFGLSDERRAERFRDLHGTTATDSNRKDEAQEVEILREFIDFDKNGDGYPEKLRVMRCGDCILECEEVNQHIYSYWTPIPIPHRLYGLSIADAANDLQAVKTALTRGVLDSVYHTVNPRLVVNTESGKGVKLDTLLSVRAGAIVECEGDVTGKVQPLTVQDLSGTGIQAMAWMDGVLETRTGVTKPSTGTIGLNPDALAKTARGQELQLNAANERKEQYAHNVAIGLQHFFRKLYRLVVTHQNEARSVKIAGKWKNIDPTGWAAELRCSVSVGLGTGARDTQLAMLSVVQADQDQIYAAWGPTNPVVTPKHLLATREEKLRVMGFKDKSRFYGDLPTDPNTGQTWAPPQQPSPEQQKLQMQAAESKQKLDAQVQEKQLDFQLERMKGAAAQEAEIRDAALKMEVAKMKAASDAEVAMFEARERMALLRAEAEEKANLAWAQFEFEKDLKTREAEANAELARIGAKAGNGAAPGSETQFGGDVG